MIFRPCCRDDFFCARNPRLPYKCRQVTYKQFSVDLIPSVDEG